jgi:trk system potassium uptake protein TrkA
MVKKQFVVIGLGRFGGTIAQTLASLGYDVMALDKNESRVNQLAPVVTQAIEVDSTDENALQELGIRNFEHAIVAIGDDIQASILTTLILKEMGVPHVTVKATSEYHSKVLEKIGADKVIQPEREMGLRVAHHLISENVIDFIELSPEYSIAEITASTAMVGKTLASLDIRANYGCNVIAIKTKENVMNISPKAETLIQSGDLLVILGSNEDINRFESTLSESYV